MKNTSLRSENEESHSDRNSLFFINKKQPFILNLKV